MSFVKANSGSSNGNGNKNRPETIVGKVIGYEKTESGASAVRVEILNEGGARHGKQAVISLLEGQEFTDLKRANIDAYNPGLPKKGKVGKIAPGGVVVFDSATGVVGGGKGGPEDPYKMVSRWMNNFTFNPAAVTAFVTGGVSDGKSSLNLHVLQEDKAFVAPKSEAVQKFSNMVLESIQNGRNPSAILVAVDAAGTATAGFSMTGTRSKDANGNWVAPQTATDIGGKGGVLANAVAKQDEKTLKAFTEAASIMVIPAEKLPVTFQAKKTVNDVDRMAKHLAYDGGLNACRMMLSLSDPSGERQTVYVNKAAQLGVKELGKFDPVAVIGERLGVKMPDAEAGAEAAMVSKAEPSPDEGPAVTVTNELDDDGLDSAFNEEVETKTEQAIGF